MVWYSLGLRESTSLNHPPLKLARNIPRYNHKQNNIMEIKLKIREERNQREIKPRSNKEVLTNEVYDAMSYSNKLLVNLYETFVGDLDEVAVYTSPNGNKNYYITQEQLEEIAKKFKLV